MLASRQIVPRDTDRTNGCIGLSESTAILNKPIAGGFEGGVSMDGLATKLFQQVSSSFLFALLLASMAGSSLQAEERRYVVVDQDASGPAGSDQTALLVFLQSPSVNLLGITVVTGDAWLDEEVAHTLRMLELIGRTDVKVYAGASYPLLRTQEETLLSETLYGKVAWKGAWRPDGHAAEVIPPLAEGNPTTKPAQEDAAHFMIRMVHEHPHQVTIYGAGPLTNIALAIRLDPHFAELAKELVLMGGSLNPRTDDPEFVNNPHHEFNFWFDPESSSITWRAPWARIVDTTVDSSIQTRPTEAMFADWAHLDSPAARYLTKYTAHPVEAYLWDELAAASWLDPSITTHERLVYMDVNTQHGAGYGDTLIWSDKDRPRLALQEVHAQTDIDFPKLEKMLHQLLANPAPGETHPLMPGNRISSTLK
jgi:purine nucleosidase